MSNAERRLADAGHTLPEPVAPVASYVPAVRTGNLLFVSGQVPIRDGKVVRGKLGADMDVEAGQDAARICCLNGLAAAKAALGSLDGVTRVVKLTVFVASASGFTDQPKVANGASDLLEVAFGDAGKHARSAVGMAELPLGVPVEVEFVFEVS